MSETGHSSRDTEHPIDRVKSDQSKAVRIGYDNGSTEVIWFRNGFLFGLFDGEGPAPVAEPDARTVCDKYDSEVIELQALQPDTDRPEGDR